MMPIRHFQAQTTAPDSENGLQSTLLASLSDETKESITLKTLQVKARICTLCAMTVQEKRMFEFQSTILFGLRVAIPHNICSLS
jgi:hypothetical protein